MNKIELIIIVAFASILNRFLSVVNSEIEMREIYTHALSWACTLAIVIPLSYFVDWVIKKKKK